MGTIEKPIMSVRVRPKYAAVAEVGSIAYLVLVTKLKRGSPERKSFQSPPTTVYPPLLWAYQQPKAMNRNIAVLKRRRSTRSFRQN